VGGVRTRGVGISRGAQVCPIPSPRIYGEVGETDGNGPL